MVGRRDDEALEAYARTMVELITKRKPDAGPLLLAISIKEHSHEVIAAAGGTRNLTPPLETRDGHAARWSRVCLCAALPRRYAEGRGESCVVRVQ
jgi:hypothetical protein